jgi:hypothetical protein
MASRGTHGHWRILRQGGVGRLPGTLDASTTLPTIKSVGATKSIETAFGADATTRKWDTVRKCAAA